MKQPAVSRNNRHMNERLPAFIALTQTDFQSYAVRSDKATLKKLNQAGLMWNNPSDIDTEWERIMFISENASGDVLEIGCATGLVTKYLNANPGVNKICSVDIVPECIEYLKSLDLGKVDARICDPTKDGLKSADRYDCVVLSEIIEHLSMQDEKALIKNIGNNIQDGKTIFIITTPLGYMPDPLHMRGFSKEVCTRHILLNYGDIIKEKTISDVYQCYAVRFKKKGYLPDNKDCQMPQNAKNDPRINSKKVSIVLPTRNGSRFIERAVKSCLGQSYSDIELIVVNDGSTDNTEELISGFRDNRIIYLKHKTGKGVPAALNKGFGAASGKYYTWTSDDNMYAPDAIEKMVCALDSEPSPVLIYSDFEISDEDGKRTEVCRRPEIDIEKYNGIGPCFLYSVHCAHDVGKYSPAWGLVEDYEYWMRFLKKYRCVNIPEVLYTYRTHKDSLTESKRFPVLVMDRLLKKRSGFISAREMLLDIKQGLDECCIHGKKGCFAVLEAVKRAASISLLTAAVIGSVSLEYIIKAKLKAVYLAVQMRRKWSSGKTHEITFWTDYLRDKGGQWPEDFRMRLDPLRVMQEKISMILPKTKNPVIIDAGSGPFSVIGRNLDGKQVKIRAVDPLAREYEKLIKKFGITTPDNLIRGRVEDLSRIFGHNYADIVYMHNALDHCSDPVKGIRQMLSVVKPGCVVMLEHNVNEAEKAQYSGLHQWNVSSEGNDLILWNRDYRLNITRIVSGIADVKITNDGKWITALLTKNRS